MLIGLTVTVDQAFSMRKAVESAIDSRRPRQPKRNTRRIDAATLWTAWSKFQAPLPPAPVSLSFTALGALVINLSCALMLVRYRTHRGSLTRAAFLSARNDVFANIAIIVAALATAIRPSAWPDLVVGLGIMALNADAAREVWCAARDEHRVATAVEY